MDVRHLLLDADGVVQHGAADFLPQVLDVLGEGGDAWLLDTFRSDGDVLEGRQEVVPLLAGWLGDADEAERLYDRVWLAIAAHPPVLALVPRWQASGLGVHLATNQDPARAAYMKQTMGYDAVLDGAFYSSDLGAAKPHATYFERVLSDLHARPDQVVLVDDSEANVAGARALGLGAVCWEAGQGADVLVARLGDLGVPA